MSHREYLIGVLTKFRDGLASMDDTIEAISTAPHMRVRRAGKDTSREASLLSFKGQRRRVFDALKELGDSTSDEIAQWINKPRATVNSRLSELERMGLIQDTGDRRVTRSGKRAAVYVHVKEPT